MNEWKELSTNDLIDQVMSLQRNLAIYRMEMETSPDPLQVQYYDDLWHYHNLGLIAAQEEMYSRFPNRRPSEAVEVMPTSMQVNRPISSDEQEATQLSPKTLIWQSTTCMKK